MILKFVLVNISAQARPCQIFWALVTLAVGVTSGTLTRVWVGWLYVGYNEVNFRKAEELVPVSLSE